MGLDMYLTGEKFVWTDWEHPENNPVMDGYEIGEYSLRIGYWRKHANLHGYIVKTFANGVDECQRIDLSKEDLEKIIDTINTRALPHTTGFFFGESDDSGEQIAHDVEILARAIVWLETKEKGVSRSLYYRASW